MLYLYVQAYTTTFSNLDFIIMLLSPFKNSMPSPGCRGGSDRERWYPLWKHLVKIVIGLGAGKAGKKSVRNLRGDGHGRPAQGH